MSSGIIRSRNFLGDVNEYLKSRDVEDFRAIEKKTNTKAGTGEQTSKKLDYNEQKKVKSLKNKISKLEKSIGTLENEISDIDHEVLMNYDQTISKPDFFNNYQQKKKELEKLMQSWEKLTSELENTSGMA